MQNTGITQQNAGNQYFTGDFNGESHGYEGDDGFYSGSAYPQTAAGFGDPTQDVAQQQAGALLDGSFADRFVNRMTGQTATPAAAPAATDSSTSGDDSSTSAKLKEMAQKNAEAFKKMTEAGKKQHEAEEAAEAKKKAAEAQAKAMEKMAQKEEAAMKKMEQKQEAQAKAMEQQMKAMEKAETPAPPPPQQDEDDTPPMVAGGQTGRSVPQVLRKIGDMMFGDAALTAAVIGMAAFSVVTVIGASLALPVLPIVAGAITLSALSYCALGGAFRVGTWVYDRAAKKKEAAQAGNVKQTSRDKEKEMFQYMDKSLDAKGVDVSRDVGAKKQSVNRVAENPVKEVANEPKMPIESPVAGLNTSAEKPFVYNNKAINAKEVKPLAPIEKKDVDLSKEIMKAAREESLQKAANKALNEGSRLPDEASRNQAPKNTNYAPTGDAHSNGEKSHYGSSNIYNAKVVEKGIGDDLTQNIERQPNNVDKWRSHEKASGYDEQADSRSQYAVGM